MQFSIVIPLKNEEDNVLPLFEELASVMDTLSAGWELIMINDGSTDTTAQVLAQLQQKDNRVRVITFDKNYGQSSAFDAGFKAAIGTYIITLDGDRQNDPADIPRLAKAIEANDLVCGQRVTRRDSWSKKITSFLANQVRSRLCQDGIQDTGCSLKIYRRSCFDKIKMYNGMHRFLPALFKIEGYKIVEIPVNHRPRVHGKTKYNFFNRSFNTIFDLFAVVWMRSRALKWKEKQEQYD
jgi:dolichol-phosphate mannosyltransferase